MTFEAVRSLLDGERPEASPVGIGLTALSIAAMLWLARAKRRTGEALGSRALKADAQQTELMGTITDILRLLRSLISDRSTAPAG